MAFKNLHFARAGIQFHSANELNILPSDCAGSGFNASPTKPPSTQIPMATRNLVSLPLCLTYDVTITLDRTVAKSNLWFSRMLSNSQIGDFTLNTVADNFSQLEFTNASITNAPDFNENPENPTGEYAVRLSATLLINNTIMGAG